MQGSRTARFAAAGVIVLGGSLVLARDDDPTRILTAPDVDYGGARDIAMLMNGFEQGQGWNLGLAGDTAPSGWGVLGGQNSPIISNLNPWVGQQHLRIEKEPGMGTNQDVGVLSPHLKLPDEEFDLFTLKMGVYINEKGGADYDVFLQSDSALAARVKFDFSGKILVVDDLAFKDTGAEWDPAEWRELRVEIDYTGSRTVARYYYGGDLIYTDSNRFDLIDDPTQFGIVSDNFNEDDFGDFDGTMMVVPSPGSLAMGLVGVALISTRRRRR